MRVTTKEKVVLGLTVARLLQGADYAQRVKAGKPIRLTTALIMGIDLADGIIARWLGVDGPSRRLADSAVDSVIIAAGLYSTLRKKPETRPYLGLLAAREVFIGTGWAIDLAKSRQPKKGDKYHKLASGSVAMAGLTANNYSERAMKVTAGLAIAVNGLLAYDYLKGWTHPERNIILETGVAEVPGFYEPRKAMHSLLSNVLQLEPGLPPLQLEPAISEPVTDAIFTEGYS